MHEQNWDVGNWAIANDGLCKIVAMDSHVWIIRTVTLDADGYPSWGDERALETGESLEPITRHETLIATEILTLMDIRARALDVCPGLTYDRPIMATYKGTSTLTTLARLDVGIEDKKRLMRIARLIRAAAKSVESGRGHSADVAEADSIPGYKDKAGPAADACVANARADSDGGWHRIHVRDAESPAFDPRLFADTPVTRYRTELHQLTALTEGLARVAAVAVAWARTMNEHRRLCRERLDPEALAGLRTMANDAYSELRGLVGNCPCGETPSEGTPAPEAQEGQGEVPDELPPVDQFVQAVEDIAPHIERFTAGAQMDITRTLREFFVGRAA